MNKSIIVLDTPTNCGQCRLRYDSYGQCEVCILADDVVDHFYETNTKPEWCPLLPMPEPKDLTQYTTGSTSLDKVIQYAHDQGFNDCIYEINGGNL